MSHKKKGQLTKSPERHKHLRKDLKRQFWKGERKQEKTETHKQRDED